MHVYYIKVSLTGSSAYERDSECHNSRRRVDINDGKIPNIEGFRECEIGELQHRMEEQT